MRFVKVDKPNFIIRIIAFIIGVSVPLLFMLIEYGGILNDTTGSSVSALTLFVLFTAGAANYTKLPLPDKSGIPIALIVVGLISKFMGDTIIYLGVVQFIGIIISNIILRWRLVRGKNN